ncbi:MAG: NAD(P)H-binding protein [Thermoleophilia bacterium]
MNSGKPEVLLTGATGFIGGRMLLALDREDYPVRCLVRSQARLKPDPRLTREPGVAVGDVFIPETLAPAMAGIETAFYLVHSMGDADPKKAREFAERDRTAAENFRRAADDAGVKRIIYLGGLGETGEAGLSEHLSSRREVGAILRQGQVAVTVLQAAVIIGAGGASFEMVRHIVERLPLLLCPREIETKCEPIAVTNVVDYLLGCLKEPRTAGQTLDIGGPEVMTYRRLMEIYARVRGLKRTIIEMPGLSTAVYGRLVETISPVPAGIVSLLLAGLSNEVVCHDMGIRELIPLRLMTMNEAICEALVDEEQGPGRLPSRQSCFLE